MMYNNLGYGATHVWGVGFPYPFVGAFAAILPLIIIWSILWKGLALFHAARKGQPWWFVILLVVNTVGILEIIYLFGVLKLKFHDLFKNK